MSLPAMDEDALVASVELIARTGARGFECGYLHDGVSVERAGWWAHAQYGGVRITEENHRGPVEAVEALARRLLIGARCTHCRGLITLSDGGAVAFPGSRMLDGTIWTEEEQRAARQCRWRRMGRTWRRGCEARKTGKQRRRRR